MNLITFAFPDNQTIHSGSVKKFIRHDNGRIDYSPIDQLSPTENIINIDHIDYYFTYLNPEITGNKGGNSIILKLFDAQQFDIDEVQYDEPDLILKILKFPKRKIENKTSKRFNKEIEALFACKKAKFQNVIDIFHSGQCKIFNPSKKRFEDFYYYTMEYAKYDLKDYIEKKHNEINIEEKVGLCISIAEGLKELYSLGYYHRDLKPDNIFLTEDDQWKIGDLGLLDERDKKHEIDDVAEAIGPRGWMSPESMNKYLCGGKGFRYHHYCKINHQSDIFQLGKVFWYILQHNAPVGVIKEADFLIKNSNLYTILRTMLNHSISRRYKNIDEVIKLLKPLESKLLKVS